MRKTRVLAVGALLGVVAALPLTTSPTATGTTPGATSAGAAARLQLPGGFKHLVVIYEENHSFDNLYGGWRRVGSDHVVGRPDAPRSAELQVAQNGSRYKCLLQNDVNLMTPPLADKCEDPGHGVSASAFGNHRFLIDQFISPTDKTCPAPGAATNVPKNSPGSQPGGCTRDLVHRFYQEQYQLNGGRMNRYVTGSDAVGLTMGGYVTKRLPIFRYLHRPKAPHYVIADHFFQAAFGGSFLNHQWLIAARTPFDTSKGASGAVNSVLDAHGMPTSYPLYTATNSSVVDKELTRTCQVPSENHYFRACGDFAVNTIQPSGWPYRDGVRLPLIDDKKYPNIGDRMTDAGITWNWFTGRWYAANKVPVGDTAGLAAKVPLFQTHHQPFNYFAAYAPGQPGRKHLQGESSFMRRAESGRLPQVSFVKPYGAENEHPGYASESDGSDHLVKLIKAVMHGPDARSTLIVVTYDEFGGQWDHVPPPGMGTRGVHDAWGPGTRIPALLLARRFTRSGVDHTVYDTTSILATIEHSYGLKPLSTRDAKVAPLTRAVRIGMGR